ncbi:MAG TPA: multidrug effflux MFS transporter [Acidimicrobiia bacterium]|nr:multidrug effflux MFS transporter [Acidimicrobiia bacterium]
MRTRLRSGGIQAGSAEFTLFLAATMSMTALGVDIMLPAFAAIREGFGLAPDATEVARVVTAYFFGIAVGQVFYGPIADYFGRKRTLLVAASLYAVGAVLSALSPSLGLLLAARFLWGLGAAGGRVIVGAIVRDVYEGDRMARAMSLVFSIFILVPVFAPALGAIILNFTTWPWVFAFCAVWAGGVLLWSRRLPETLAPENRLADLSFARLKLAARFVLGNRITVGHTAALAVLFGAFTSYLASAEIMFAEVFGVVESFPVYFGALAAVMGLMMFINGRVVERIGLVRLSRWSMVVYIAASGLFMLAILSQQGRPPLWVFVAGMAVIMATHALLIPNLNSRALQPMGEVAGMAAAIVGTASTLIGASLGALLDARFDGTVTPFGIALFAASVAATLLLRWSEQTQG